jgi:membrane protein required for colicin V production
MNWLDIVIVILLIFAVWEGWRQGVITQVLGLAAVVLGIFLAWRFGRGIGVWLGMEGMTATVAGFAIVLVVAVVAVVLIGRLTRGLFRIVGLGMFDNVLGVVFSALKMSVLVGLVMMLVEAVDPQGRVVSESVRERSAMYGAVNRVNGAIVPFVKDIFK